MRKLKTLLISIGMSIIAVFVAISMEAEAAGTNLSTATKVELNSTYSGKLTSNKQNDYYKFTISKNSIVKISVETAGHKEHCVVALRDGSGDKLSTKAGNSFFTTDDDDNWGYQQGSRKCGLNAGTYYVIVYKNSGPDVNYDVKVETVEKESSSVKIAGYENLYKGEARSISVGNKLTSIAVHERIDGKQYYKFKVSKKRTVILKFSTPLSSNGNSVWFDVYDSSGKKIEHLSCYSSEEKKSKTFKQVLSAGTYYIGVCSPNYNDITYTIKTAYKPYSTKITSLKSKSKAITVKWDEKSSITGYQIQYSQKSNFSNAKKITVSSGNESKKIKSLKAGKKYYVRVRTYKKAFGETYYSDWSTKKSITVKK